MSSRENGRPIEPGDALRATTTVEQQCALLRVVARGQELERAHGRAPMTDVAWTAVLTGSLSRLEEAHPGDADELVVHHAALCLAWLEQMEESRAAARLEGELTGVRQ